MAHYALEATGLEKRYHGRAVVRDIGFAMSRGEVLGLIGPNGAGKTTTIRMISGASRPTAGRVAVDGHDLESSPLAARRQIGYLPEHTPLYDEMRVGDYLRLRTRLKRVARGEVAARIDDVVARLELDSVRGRVIRELSKGFRQRVGLAAALVSRPPVLILDEPTVGLDPAQARHFRELIGELKDEHAIVISSHALRDLERVSDRVLFIAGGRQLAVGTPEELRARLPAGRITLRARAVTEALIAAFEADPRVADCVVTRDDDGIACVSVAGANESLQAWIGERAAQHGAVVIELRSEPPDLEALFHELVPFGGQS